MTGVFGCPFHVRAMYLSRAAIVVFLFVGLGAALHAYECLRAQEASWSWFLWGMLPYFVCLAVLAASVSAIPAAVGAGLALLFDLATHYSVFVSPTHSTAALGLVFAPIVSGAITSPLAMLIAWVAVCRAGGGAARPQPKRWWQR